MEGLTLDEQFRMGMISEDEYLLNQQYRAADSQTARPAKGNSFVGKLQERNYAQQLQAQKDALEQAKKVLGSGMAQQMVSRPKGVPQALVPADLGNGLGAARVIGNGLGPGEEIVYDQGFTEAHPMIRR